MEEKQIHAMEDSTLGCHVLLGTAITEMDQWTDILWISTSHESRVVDYAIQTRRTDAHQRGNMESEKYHVGRHGLHAGMYLTENRNLSHGGLFDLGDSKRVGYPAALYYTVDRRHGEGLYTISLSVYYQQHLIIQEG